MRSAVLAIALVACGDHTILVGRAVAPAQQGTASLSTPCVRSGCNGELCDSIALDSACIAKPTDACYAAARCERQTNGRCAFTEDTTLTQCIAAKTPVSCEAGGAQCIPFVEQNCKEGTWLDLREHTCFDRIGEGCCLPTRTLSACEKIGGACLAKNGNACDDGVWRDESCDSVGTSCCGPKP